MKVLGYVRVSTAEQTSNGESLGTQQRMIAGYAMIQGWEIAEFFVEGGVSGSVPLSDRPQGARLIGAAGKGDVIITAKLDRMFRSAADALATLEALKAEGIGLHMIDLGGDVCGNGISKLVFTILSAVAENERDRIRERIRDVKRSLAAQGIYNGGKVPFGFQLDEGRLVPNPAEQKTLATMRKMKARGASLREIGAAVGKHPESVKRILARGV
jgi:DNA invertase Pin-like site-specific DNA recombinase